MRYLVTGATGWIGSAVVPELLARGHQVVGLARTDEAAARLEAIGASAHRGDLTDPAGLASAAAASDGVVHLAYDHDFSAMEASARLDREAITAMGDALVDSDRPLLIASGVVGLATGRPGTEDDRPDPTTHPRVANSELARSFADRGVRSIVVRFAPTVHGAGDHGFVPTLVEVARNTGVAGYVGDGTNRWPAVHRDDAARLVALALEGAPAGSMLHAVAEEGVEGRAIAETIATGLGLETTSIAPEEALAHFGWIGMFFSLDAPVTNAATRDLLAWEPTGPGLLTDISEHYVAG
jgi:nucleoside-diphosphate-sugar epimerase